MTFRKRLVALLCGSFVVAGVLWGSDPKEDILRPELAKLCRDMNVLEVNLFHLRLINCIRDHLPKTELRVRYMGVTSDQAPAFFFYEKDYGFPNQ